MQAMRCSAPARGCRKRVMVDAPVGAAVKLLLASDMPVIAHPGRSAAQRFT